jgi:hypothetical protein
MVCWRTAATTTEPSWPAFSAIWRTGASSGVRRSESAVWHVATRIVERALLAPEPRLDGRG